MSLCLCGYLFLTFTQPASASNSNVLADLAAPEYETRQRASEMLLTEESLTLDEIAQMYARATSPEQQQRLLAVAQHHFLRRQQDVTFPPPGSAAIGMSHETVPGGAVPEIDGPAVQVMRTLPGFPAYARLRVDDLIIGFEGQPLPRNLIEAGFTPLIEGRSQGDEVELTILRSGQRLTIRVRLAGSVALNAMFDGGTLDLRPPFRERWQAVYQAIVTGQAIPDQANSE